MYIKEGKFGSRLFARAPHRVCFLVGIIGGVMVETIQTFMKPPGGETFYDFQRRKACKEKYGYEWKKVRGKSDV